MQVLLSHFLLLWPVYLPVYLYMYCNSLLCQENQQSYDFDWMFVLKKSLIKKLDIFEKCWSIFKTTIAEILKELNKYCFSLYWKKFGVFQGTVKMSVKVR